MIITSPILLWNIRDVYLLRFELLADVTCVLTLFIIFSVSYLVPGDFPPWPEYHSIWWIYIIFVGTTPGSAAPLRGRSRSP